MTPPNGVGLQSIGARHVREGHARDRRYAGGMPRPADPDAAP
jgi:hypothetical protein